MTLFILTKGRLIGPVYMSIENQPGLKDDDNLYCVVHCNASSWQVCAYDGGAEGSTSQGEGGSLC